jgi:hypothetical protein
MITSALPCSLSHTGGKWATISGHLACSKMLYMLYSVGMLQWLLPCERSCAWSGRGQPKSVRAGAITSGSRAAGAAASAEFCSVCSGPRSIQVRERSAEANQDGARRHASRGLADMIAVRACACSLMPGPFSVLWRMPVFPQRWATKVNGLIRADITNCVHQAR